jgi:hypothetical protein
MKRWMVVGVSVLALSMVSISGCGPAKESQVMPAVPETADETPGIEENSEEYQKAMEAQMNQQ